MERIEELEDIFKLDLEVKKLIDSSRPSIYNDDPVKEESNLLNVVEISRKAINKMLSFANLDIEDEFEEKFNKIKKDIENCNYNVDKLTKVYENDILFNSKDLEKSLEINIIGFGCLDNINEPLEKCTSINDMLHFVHFYIINNDRILRSMNVVEEVQKGEYDWESYKLYGKDNELARDIFNKLPEDETLIIEVSFDGHVLIMVRDRGHALSMDVQFEENDNCRVSYFIPKACNIEKINKIKGVNKLDESINSRFDPTHGEFICKKDEIGSEINSFIKSVPTDNDINFNYFDNFKSSNMSM